jgi:hypothetical protein
VLKATRSLLLDEILGRRGDERLPEGPRFASESLDADTASGSAFFETNPLSHVGIPETVTLQLFTGDNGQLPAEHGATIDKGMELAILSAGIHSRRQIV